MRTPTYAPSRARPEPVRLKCRPPLATRFASSRYGADKVPKSARRRGAKRDYVKTQAFFTNIFHNIFISTDMAEILMGWSRRACVCAPSTPPAPRRFALAPALAVFRYCCCLQLFNKQESFFSPMGAPPIASRQRKEATPLRASAPSKLRIRTAPAGSVRCGRHMIRARMRLCRLLALLAWLPALLSARRLRHPRRSPDPA